MTPERWKQVEEVFQTALDLQADERRRYIEIACAGDDALLEQVISLVTQYEAAGDFIEEPAFASISLATGALGRETDPQSTNPMIFPELDPAIGRRVGSYRLVREVGRGGMGAVYEALRADGEFRHRVAVKLIKRGMDTDFILRRFRNERQILATLDHPFIAKLLDGGTTDDGLPYFVMEFIEGAPVYRFCDERKLTVAERLRLFQDVCEAVHYAHQKLVIHRDIKPSNILVTTDSVPKLLDFGIAKLLNPEFAGEITLDPTATAMRLMTPEYAAPEQVQGQPVSPSTDVYSLGILLYELLTGHRPYRLRNRSPHEIARVICEEEPAHPSVRITSPEDLLPAPAAASNGGQGETLEYLYWCRAATVETLRTELAGDLDNIIMKALRKSPQERYQSVQELSDDITRHLEGRPVAAPPFFHAGSGRLLLPPHENEPDSSTSLAVLPLKILDPPTTGGDTGMDYLGVGLADALITRLGGVRRFALRPTSSVVRYSAPDSDPLKAGRELGVAYVLEGRVRRVGERIRVTVQLLDVRAGSTVWAGQFDESASDVLQLEDSISNHVAEALIPQLTGGERLRLAKRGTDNADAYQEYLRGRYHWNTFTEEGFAKALVHYSRAVALDPDYALAYAGIADYYNWLGVYTVLPFAETSAAAKEAALKAVALDDSLAEGYAALGFATLMHDYDWDATERHLRRAIDLNPSYATGRVWYSYLLGMEGRFDEALAQVRRAIDLDPHTPIVRQTMSWAYFYSRRYDEAVAAARQFSSREPNYGLGLIFLSLVMFHTGQHEEALRAVTRAIELLGRTPYTLCWLATAHAAAGRREQALAVLNEVREMQSGRYVAPYLLAMVHMRLGDEGSALAELERALLIRDGRLAWLGVDPIFDDLRGLTRFEDLLRRTNNPLAARPTAQAEPVTGQRSIAVLPLRVISADGGTGGSGTGDDYLGIGLADALITRLSNVHRFIVRPTSSVLRFRGEAADPLEAGRELGVDFVIDGTVRRSGQTFRVTAQLLSVEEGSTRWAGRFDEEYTDVLRLEDSISEQVARALVPHLTGDEREQLARRGTDNAEAYEAFLRGRYHWYTMSEEGFAKSISCYQRAINLDQNYAEAYAGVAEYHAWLAVYGLAEPAVELRVAREAAQKAIDLDENLAAAHTSHGLSLLTHEWQWRLAGARFRRAIELSPNYTQAHAHYACQLAMEGRFDESVAEARRACEIDPLNPFNFYFLSWCLYQSRRFTESAEEARRLLRIDPRYGSARFVLSWLMRRAGEHEESVADAKRAIELLGEVPMLTCALACAHAAAGREDEAREILASLESESARRFVTPYHRALVRVALGEHEQALALLRQAVEVEDPWVVWLGTEPQLDPLRGAPEFDELLRRTHNPLRPVAPPGQSGARASTDATPSKRALEAPTRVHQSVAPNTGGDQDNEEAQKLFTAGRYFATRRTADGLRQAVERFERAVRLAPQFALAYAEMADCYALLNWYVEPPPPGAWERAQRAAHRAVEADDSLAEAHASLGFVKLYHERDYEGAERELRRAVELKPESAVARRWHAFNLSAMGRHEEAYQEIRKAQELNPTSPVATTGVANVLFFARRFDEAIGMCLRALDLDPGSMASHIVLRWSYEMSGRCEDAFTVYEQESAFAGETPTTRAKRAHVYASCGRADEAREILRGLVARRDEEWVTAYEIAVIYSLLGERDEAFAWLTLAAEEHAVGLAFVRVDPRLDNLRPDPRFDNLLKRLSEQRG
jgi:serine/threonine protein kinase/tetratricopeptide (TPR) repeat protein